MAYIFKWTLMNLLWYQALKWHQIPFWTCCFLLPGIWISSNALIGSLLDAVNAEKLQWHLEAVGAAGPSGCLGVVHGCSTRFPRERREADWPEQPADVWILMSRQHINCQVRCVHPLQLEKVLISSLPACKWSGSEQGRPGAFLARGIFSHTNQGAYYFWGSQELWTADSPGLKDSWRRGYQGTSSRLERSEVGVIPTATTEKQIRCVKGALLVHLLYMFNVACCGCNWFITGGEHIDIYS